jgi:hypothetical protein
MTHDGLGHSSWARSPRSANAERGRQLALVPADRVSQTRHILREREGGLGNGKRGPLTQALGGDEALGPVAEDQLVVAPAGFLRACQAQFRTEGFYLGGRRGDFEGEQREKKGKERRVGREAKK